MTSSADSIKFIEHLRQILATSGTPRARLFALIEWIDQSCADDARRSLAQQTLARAVVAAGELDPEPIATVSTTLQAAKTYAFDPSDDHFDALQNSATDSYPFGPGDGCLSVVAIGYKVCEVGSGCHSGAGTLACSAEMLGDERVVTAVWRSLNDWCAEVSARS